MKKYLAAILLLTITGCSDAEKSAIFAAGSKHKIQLYSGGVLVREWTSTGMIQNEDHSDGYYFRDEATGKLVTVSGEVVITQE